MKSKSVLILSIFIFAIHFIGLSQKQEFILGPFIGFYGVHVEGEIENMYSPTNGTISGNGGLSFGLNVKRYFSKTIYAELELRYMQKGSIYQFTTSYGTSAFETLHLDYIEIPILFGMDIKLKKKRLFFETGIAYGVLVRSELAVSEFYLWDPSAKLNQIKDNDISWIANVKYPITKNEKLLLGARFSHSVTSISTEYKLYNMDYGIEVYYLINGGN